MSALGDIAQGVSKGLSQAAIDRERNERAKMQRQERMLQKEADERAEALADKVKNQPIVGQTKVGLGGVDYLRKQQDDALAASKKQAMSEEDRGIVSKIAGIVGLGNLIKTRKAAEDMPPPPAPVEPGAAPAAAAAAAPAAAAPTLAPAAQGPAVNTGAVDARGGLGIAPPEAAPASTAGRVNAPSVGLQPDATPTAAALRTAEGVGGSLRGEAPPLASELKPGPTPGTVVDAKGVQLPAPPKEVPVAGTPELTRPATDTDRQLYMAKAYADARMIPEAEAAYKAYGKMVLTDKLSVIDSATASEIGQIASEADKKHKYSVTRSKDDPDSWSMSVQTIGPDGTLGAAEPVMTDVSKGELKGHISRYIGANEEFAQALITNSSAARTAAMKARMELAKGRAAITQSGAVTRHYDADSNRIGETVLTSQEKRIQAKQDRDDETWGNLPGSSVLDPARMKALSTDKRWNYEKKVPDPNGSGLYVPVQGNYMADKLKAEQADWEQNAWSTPSRRIVVRVEDENGPGFAVIGPDGKYTATVGKDGKRSENIFNSTDEAYEEAANVYRGKTPDQAFEMIKQARGIQGAAPAGGKAPRAGLPAEEKKPAVKKAPAAPAPLGAAANLVTAQNYIRTNLQKYGADKKTVERLEAKSKDKAGKASPANLSGLDQIALANAKTRVKNFDAQNKIVADASAKAGAK